MYLPRSPHGDDMKTIHVKFASYDSPLLMNNPQCVDSFNEFSKAKKIITSKRSKTDEDQMELRRLDLKSKLYFDEEEGLGVYVPTTWVAAAMAANSWNRVKIKKAEIRSGVFPTRTMMKLHYTGEDKVKTAEDIARNPFYTKTLLLKQGQVKIAKCSPIFRDWYFEVDLDYDPEIIDQTTLENLLQYCAKYGGFGDFRPTFGRATCEVTLA